MLHPPVQAERRRRLGLPQDDPRDPAATMTPAKVVEMHFFLVSTASSDNDERNLQAHRSQARVS
jgi:hypothetical protein